MKHLKTKFKELNETFLEQGKIRRECIEKNMGKKFYVLVKEYRLLLLISAVATAILGCLAGICYILPKQSNISFIFLHDDTKTTFNYLLIGLFTAMLMSCLIAIVAAYHMDWYATTAKNNMTYVLDRHFSQ